MTVSEAWDAVHLHEVECAVCAASVDEEAGVAPYEDHCARGRALLDAVWDLEESEWKEARK